MLPTDDPIIPQEGQHTVAGSHGVLLVDDATGNVLQYKADDGSDHYRNIVRFNIPEYVEYNGGMDDTDILLIGYWTDTGYYEPPVVEEREHRGPEITLKHKATHASD